MCVCVCLCVCVYIVPYVYMCAGVCVRVCMCTCVYFMEMGRGFFVLDILTKNLPPPPPRKTLNKIRIKIEKAILPPGQGLMGCGLSGGRYGYGVLLVKARQVSDC